MARRPRHTATGCTPKYFMASAAPETHWQSAFSSNVHAGRCVAKSQPRSIWAQASWRRRRRHTNRALKPIVSGDNGRVAARELYANTPPKPPEPCLHHGRRERLLQPARGFCRAAGIGAKVEHYPAPRADRFRRGRDRCALFLCHNSCWVGRRAQTEERSLELVISRQRVFTAPAHRRSVRRTTHETAAFRQWGHFDFLKRQRYYCDAQNAQSIRAILTSSPLTWFCAALNWAKRNTPSQSVILFADENSERDGGSNAVASP